ncbi:hypothetical protein D3C81_2126900 [compost metagenome]
MIFDNRQEIEQVLKVIEWLANAHHYDVTDLLIQVRRIQMLLDLHNLLHNLSAGEIPALRQQPTCTEAAADIAAHLRSNTYRQAVFLSHKHCLDQVAIL